MGQKHGIRPARLGKLIGLVGLVALAATGCSADQAWHFGWPDAITPQGERMRTFWMWAGITALIVGVIVWGLMLWAVAFHRKKKNAADDELPRQFQHPGKLELVYTIVPGIIVVILFIFTVTTQNFVMDKIPNPDLTVKVTAFQWNWEFDYQGYKTPDGQPVKTVGSSQEIPLLVLPTEKVIQYDLLSTDVIHSFFVPAFNFKRDVFPDPDKNNQDSSFQNTIDQTGAFVGRCAELCGTYHSMMNFEVRALPDNLFSQYIQLRTQVNPSTALPYSASEALTKLGQQDPTCGSLCTPYATTTHPFDTNRTAREASTGSGNGS
ncbi:MAG TPA: cytochrome c oxidase subunit II [Pseudonocardiaceae bacterium]|nr:cytochrome c oxidase subunit II [Pseudonocardiaceae bacterium]